MREREVCMGTILVDDYINDEVVSMANE